MKSNKNFFFLLNLTAQQATLSPLTQSLSNVLISEYSEHTVEFSWRNATFLKIDRLYQCWRNSENTLLQIFPRRENWWNQTMQTATKLSWNFIFQYFKVGSLSQFISSSSSSSRSSLNVFWKVFAEVGYKWLGNLTDCKGGSQDNKAHSRMMMLIIMLTNAMLVMIHNVQAENSKSNHLVPTTWQGTSGILAKATINMPSCRKIIMLVKLSWTARKGWKFI